MNGVVQGIVWAPLEVLSCKTGGRALCFWIIDGHPAGCRHQTCHGDVHLFPSLKHTEADEAVDTEGIQAAAEGVGLLPVPEGSFPAPLPQETLENPRTTQEFGLKGTFKNHPLQPLRTEVLTAWAVPGLALMPSLPRLGHSRWFFSKALETASATKGISAASGWRVWVKRLDEK